MTWEPSQRPVAVSHPFPESGCHRRFRTAGCGAAILRQLCQVNDDGATSRTNIFAVTGAADPIAPRGGEFFRTLPIVRKVRTGRTPVERTRRPTAPAPGEASLITPYHAGAVTLIEMIGTMVPRGGIEPPTLRFSVACSTN
jgi:hypothetical protein